MSEKITQKILIISLQNVNEKGDDTMINTQLIEELRLQHGYTQEQIAIKLGYNSKGTYNLKIKRQRQFTIEDVTKLCSIYNVTPNQLIIIEKVGK